MTDKGIFKLISRFSPNRKLMLDKTFKEVGFDSLDMIEMIMDLEIELDVDLCDIVENPDIKVSDFISDVLKEVK